jgi:hypothetical protein
MFKTKDLLQLSAKGLLKRHSILNDYLSDFMVNRASYPRFFV